MVHELTYRSIVLFILYCFDKVTDESKLALVESRSTQRLMEKSEVGAKKAEAKLKVAKETADKETAAYLKKSSKLLSATANPSTKAEKAVALVAPSLTAKSSTSISTVPSTGADKPVETVATGTLK